MSDAFMSVEHGVVPMLDNRSFDHRLGSLHADHANCTANGQPFEGRNGAEKNPDSTGGDALKPGDRPFTGPC